MANDYFQFKKFTIFQDKCAMKVGTDGVMLGAWVNIEKSYHRILDVGTGTGLIAIMLAQRSKADIDAVEIDEHAAEQADQNRRASLWNNRISVHHISLQDFVDIQKKNYDLIVANPPYFKNSFKNADILRNIARHDDLLSLDALLSSISKLLNESGRFAIIYPAESYATLCEKAERYGLFPNRLTEVFPAPGISSHRILSEFTSIEEKIKKGRITIESGGRHNYSPEYRKLTKDFYLNF